LRGRLLDPDDQVLQDIVRRVVEAANPERIIMFGSAALDGMGKDSDIDLLVVKSGVHQRQITARVYRKLIGAGYPVDVMVVTPEDIERYGDSPALVIRDALTSGKVLYAA
jgi:uncharacterized protein